MTARITAIACAALVLTTAPLAPAAWNSDVNVNTAISTQPNEQGQPKIRPTADGGCYISWLGGVADGHDTYVQRLDRVGNLLFTPPGVLVVDTSFSSSQDYGFEVDMATGSAWVAFRDDRFGGQVVSANGVSPAGTLLWGPNGVQLVDSTNGNAPRLAVLPDGIVVGWSVGSVIRLQKLDATGSPMWIGGIVETPAAGLSYSLADLRPSEDGGVIALWVRGGGFTTPRHLYTQKYDAAGTRLWNGGNPRIIFDLNSIQFGYFPTFLPDGAGGAVYCWYETGGSRHAYVQRVDSAGNLLYPAPGVPLNTTGGRIRLTPAHAFHAATGETFAFWVETNSAQSQWGVYGQKISPAGARQWGDSGLEVTPLDANQESFVGVVPFLDGAMAFWFESSGAARILGARFDSGGLAAWTPALRTVSNRLTEKSRLDVNRTPSGMALLAWGDGPATGNRDIYATNVNPPSGSVGLPVFLHGDTDCDGDIDFDDIDPFVAALGGQAAYEAQYPGCYWLNADGDGDGDVDFDDIDAFVGLIGM